MSEKRALAAKCVKVGFLVGTGVVVRERVDPRDAPTLGDQPLGEV